VFDFVYLKCFCAQFALLCCCYFWHLCCWTCSVV